MNFSDFPNIIFASSSKDFGNMSFVVGNTSNVIKNRKQFLSSLGLSFKDIITLIVKHSDKVVIATEKNLGKGAKALKSSFEADAVITKKKGIFVMLLTADCLPIFLYNPITGSVGLTHSSRKNISKIIKNTLEALVKNLGSEPNDIFVLIGPSIGPCHYEVDLWKIAQEELIKQGVKKENISNQMICNYEDQNYFSHRRSIDSGETESRFANIIGLRV